MGWLPDDVWLAQKAAREAKGKGKGGGGKGWSSPWQPMFQKTWSKPSWGGGGWGKGFGKKGKGKGKGLRDFDPAQKVWVGSLPAEATWKELQTHMNQAGTTKWIEVFEGKGKGTAGVAYSTAEEAQAALASLNGSVLGTGAIIVDVWEKKTKEA
mmetsp:Transcript_97282/g.251655  ORF Transcript_97282/g.251655 Transcript_97282/m.251655 type:complete len:154 (+) Transcript_97282:79-540(+)